MSIQTVVVGNFDVKEAHTLSQYNCGFHIVLTWQKGMEGAGEEPGNVSTVQCYIRLKLN